MFNYYHELIRLKLNHPVMRDYNRDEVNASQINDHAVLLTRKLNENHLIALMNFNKRKLAFQLPIDVSRLKLLIDSAEKKWGGERENEQEIFSGNEINVFPSSIVILSDIF